MSYQLTFDISSYWHAGTGRGDGAVADAVVARTAEGLPYLPGRPVQGLLRAVLALGALARAIPSGEAERLFGSAGVAADMDADDRDRELEEARFRTEPGRVRVSSATLGTDWTAWARSGPPELPLLFGRFATTALDEHGVARDQTLRVIEVTPPMELVAHLDGLDEQGARALEAVLPWIRSLGSHRNRGLGRVEVRLEGEA